MSSITAILESDNIFGLGAQLVSENTKAYHELEELTEEQKQLLGTTVEKVTVNKNKEGSCFIEYSGNLERYIQDQKLLSVEEAVDNICELYSLSKNDIFIVVDESAINKVDIIALKDTYNVVKK